MALEKEVKLSAPVPGMSLTAEPKSRPWRKPYMHNSVDDVATYYMDKILTAEFADGLVEQVEVGFPLATIADVWVTASTMEGVHSIDLGTLVSPVIISAMKALLDAEGVSYKIGDEREEITMSKKKMMELRDDLLEVEDTEGAESPSEEMEMVEEQSEGVEEAPSRGLMSRV